MAILAACSACQSKPKQRAVPAASAPVVPRLPALAAASWLIDLDVTGFASAKVAVPVGASEPRAIVIALHGVADRPEWACGAYRGIVGGKPFVLCPRGEKRADLGAAERYTFATSERTSRELRAALSALKSRFGAYVAPGPVLLAGFEIGADHAAQIALQEPSFFARLLLVGGPKAAWPSSFAALFGQQGGQLVLFGCGPAQRSDAVWQAELTKKGGAQAQVVVLGGDPPDLGPDSVSRLARELATLTSAKPVNYGISKGNALPLGGPVLGRPAP